MHSPFCRHLVVLSLVLVWLMMGRGRGKHKEPWVEKVTSIRLLARSEMCNPVSRLGSATSFRSDRECDKCMENVALFLFSGEQWC